MSLRVVLDTNVLLRAALNPNSYSGQILDACDQRSVIVLLSDAVLFEYREVLGDPLLQENYPRLRDIKLDLLLAHLRYVGDFYRPVRNVFTLPRDPKDERWLDLSLRGRATHLITTDKDLLSLWHERSEAGKKVRQLQYKLQIVDPRGFVQQHLPRSLPG